MSCDALSCDPLSCDPLSCDPLSCDDIDYNWMNEELSFSSQNNELLAPPTPVPPNPAHPTPVIQQHKQLKQIISIPASIPASINNLQTNPTTPIASMNAYQATPTTSIGDPTPNLASNVSSNILSSKHVEIDHCNKPNNSRKDFPLLQIPQYNNSLTQSDISIHSPGIIILDNTLNQSNEPNNNDISYHITDHSKAKRLSIGRKKMDRLLNVMPDANVTLHLDAEYNKQMEEKANAEMEMVTQTVTSPANNNNISYIDLVVDETINNTTSHHSIANTTIATCISTTTDNVSTQCINQHENTNVTQDNTCSQSDSHPRSDAYIESNTCPQSHVVDTPRQSHAHPLVNTSLQYDTHSQSHTHPQPDTHSQYRTYSQSNTHPQSDVQCSINNQTGILSPPKPQSSSTDVTPNLSTIDLVNNKESLQPSSMSVMYPVEGINYSIQLDETISSSDSSSNKSHSHVTIPPHSRIPTPPHSSDHTTEQLINKQNTPILSKDPPIKNPQCFIVAGSDITPICVTYSNTIPIGPSITSNAISTCIDDSIDDQFAKHETLLQDDLMSESKIVQDETLSFCCKSKQNSIPSRTPIPNNSGLVSIPSHTPVPHHGGLVSIPSCTPIPNNSGLVSIPSHTPVPHHGGLVSIPSHTPVPHHSGLVSIPSCTPVPHHGSLVSIPSCTPIPNNSGLVSIPSHTPIPNNSGLVSIPSHTPVPHHGGLMSIPSHTPVPHHGGLVSIPSCTPVPRHGGLVSIPSRTPVPHRGGLMSIPRLKEVKSSPWNMIQATSFVAQEHHCFIEYLETLHSRYMYMYI